MKAVLLNSTLLICLCAFFFNCKKEKNSPRDIQETNQNISTDSINGELSVRQNFFLSHDSLIFSNNTVFALFFQGKAVKNFTISPHTVYVGNVSLNGVQFNVQTGSSYYTYIDTTGTSFTAPYNWQIQGANGHSGFNVTENVGFPIYANGSALPDTLIIDQQDTINIGNYTGTSVTITIQSSMGNWGYIIKTIDYPSNSLIVLPQEYSDMRITDGSATINVFISKSYYKPINSKMYRFTSAISFSKPIYLKYQ